MAQVVFSVESDSSIGDRWCIKHCGSKRATYASKTQAIVDARQLAAFESELRGRTALVIVLGVDGELVENFVCDGFYRNHRSVRRPAPSVRAPEFGRTGNTEAQWEYISQRVRADSGHS